MAELVPLIFTRQRLGRLPGLQISLKAPVISDNDDVRLQLLPEIRHPTLSTCYRVLEAKSFNMLWQLPYGNMSSS
ncbi:hypothetical protein D3C73_1559970 [compost metagenome]